jgi:hypothetical protein
MGMAMRGLMAGLSHDGADDGADDWVIAMILIAERLKNSSGQFSMVHRRPFDRGQNLTLAVISHFHRDRNNQRDRSNREGDRECDVPVRKHEIGRKVLNCRINDCSQNAEEQRDRKRDKSRQKRQRKDPRAGADPMMLFGHDQHLLNYTSYQLAPQSSMRARKPVLNHDNQQIITGSR